MKNKGSATDTVAPDATAIRDACNGQNLNANLRLFSFDHNGEAVHEPVVLIVRDGALQLFGASE